MINYMRSEIYRNLRAKGNYIFPFVLISLVILLNVVLWGCNQIEAGFPYATTKFAFSNLYGSLQFLMILCCFIGGLIFGQEYKNQTLKNAISFGISKSIIYLTKLLLSVIYSLIVAVLVLVAFIGSAYLLLENSGVEHLNILITAIATTIPIFLFCLTLINCASFFIEREGSIYVFFGVIVAVIPSIIAMLGQKSELCARLAAYMPWNILSDITWGETITLSWANPEGIFRIMLASIVGCIVFYFLGLEMFKRKEIK
ncbi:MAG: hypothetical protein ACRC6T_00615 [Sarcina sp.]